MWYSVIAQNGMLTEVSTVIFSTSLFLSNFGPNKDGVSAQSEEALNSG